MGQKKSRIPEDANSARKQNGPHVLYSGPPDPRLSEYRHQQGNVYEKEGFRPDIYYQDGSCHDQQHAESLKCKKKYKKKKNDIKSKKSKNESDPERSVSNRHQHKKEGKEHTTEQGQMVSGTKKRDQYRDLTPVNESGWMCPGGSRPMNYQNGSHALQNAGPSTTSFPGKRQEMERTNRDLNEKITYEEELQRQREINRQLQAEKNDLQNRNEALNEEVRKNKQDLQNRNRDFNEKIRTQEEDLQRKTEKIKQLEADIKDVLNRLSSEAAARMTHNNPNITDLSDKDRPTKISERYAELYDNQWTDAFENLQKSHGLLDTEVIEFLLDVLFISFDECKRTRSEREDLVKFLNKYVGDDQDVRVLEVMRILKGAQKTKITKMQKDYTKKVHERLEAKYKKNWLQSIIPYMDECVEICLLMNIQDPALELRGISTGDRISMDLAVYKPYTKSGSKIDHIVWPALYLYEDGPLLSKGVAQGMRLSFKGQELLIAEHDVGKKEPKTEVNTQQEETKVHLRRDRVLNGNNVKNEKINKLSEQETKIQASPASQGSNRENNAHQSYKEIDKKSQTQYYKPDSSLKSGTNHSASTVQKKNDTTLYSWSNSVKF